MRYRCISTCFFERFLCKEGEVKDFPSTLEVPDGLWERLDNEDNVIDSKPEVPVKPPKEEPKEEQVKWKRSDLFAALKSKGLAFNYKAKNVELIALLEGK